MSACGDGGLLEPPGPELEEPDMDEPEVPDLPITAPVVGDTIWALDLRNRRLLFGSESLETVSRISGIRGVTTLHHIVGLAMRPSDGRLYGVGNDSFLYAIDPHRSYVMGSCDPDEWDWESLWEIPGLEMTGCAEATVGPDGNLFVSILDVARDLNSLYTIDPETGESEALGDMPVDSPIQDFVFL